MTFIGLDSTQFERTIGSGSDSPLPTGFYKAAITRAELKDNKPTAKDPNGKYLEVEFDINEPFEYGNRKFWDKFNLINSNPVAVKIGKEQLADLAQALGIAMLGDADELIGKSCALYLTVKPAQGQYSASNACMKYLPPEASEADYQAWYASKKGSRPVAGAAPERKAWGAAPAAAEAVPDAPATKAAAPWKKK
jgi:hypothetical protein